ncbi:MAG: hypothetical protein PVS3B3_06930 [Ktedonobacteraceae bacterium]
MLSAIVTALLLVVMVTIVTSFLLGGWQEQLRYKKMFLQQTSAVTYPLTHAEKSAYVPPISLPTSWYTRRRTLVSLGLLSMVLLALFLQDGLTEGGLRTLSKGLSFTFLSASQASDLQTSAHATPIPVLPVAASARLVRIDSASREQYRTDYQWKVWSYSSCSGIAMTMVMNSYGRNLIAADVLQEELNLGVWDVNLGLLREEGITMTASYYGFDTNANHTRTLQDIIILGNKGIPVIVGVRDSNYYPGGHIFVVRGGDDQNVYIADSSRANFQRMSHTMFLNMWQGFSAVLTPHA